jgi:hypothetical protein
MPDINSAPGAVSHKYSKEYVEVGGRGKLTGMEIPDLDLSAKMTTRQKETVLAFYKFEKKGVKGVMLQNVATGETTTQLMKKGRFRTKLTVIHQGMDDLGLVKATTTKTAIQRTRVPRFREINLMEFKPTTKVTRTRPFREIKTERALEGWYTDYQKVGDSGITQISIARVRQTRTGEFKTRLFGKQTVDQTVFVTSKARSKTLARQPYTAAYPVFVGRLKEGKGFLKGFAITPTITGKGKAKLGLGLSEGTFKHTREVLGDDVVKLSEHVEVMKVTKHQPARFKQENIFGGTTSVKVTTKEEFRWPEARELIPRIFTEKKAQKLGTMKQEKYTTINIHAPIHDLSRIDDLSLPVMQPIARKRARVGLLPIFAPARQTSEENLFKAPKLPERLNIAPISSDFKLEGKAISIMQPIQAQKRTYDYLNIQLVIPKTQTKSLAVQEPITQQRVRGRGGFYFKIPSLPTPPPPPKIPDIPLIPLPEFTGEPGRKVHRKQRGRKKRKFLYQPDVTSALFGFKGKEPKFLDPFVSRPLGVL